MAKPGYVNPALVPGVDRRKTGCSYVHWGSLCFGKMNVYHTVVFENLLGIFKEVKWLALAL